MRFVESMAVTLAMTTPCPIAPQFNEYCISDMFNLIVSGNCTFHRSEVT